MVIVVHIEQQKKGIEPFQKVSPEATLKSKRGERTEMLEKGEIEERIRGVSCCCFYTQ